MSSNSEYFLSSGEFAKMCNTTRDTLRHYHDMGILIPQKNEENGYYYYSVSQITSFYFINIFRQLDTPLKNIKSCLFSPDESFYYDFCGSQLQNLIQMRQELDNKIGALGNAYKLMSYMREAPEGEPMILDLHQIPVYFVTPIRSKHSGRASDIVEDLRQHIKTCNEKPYIHTFPVSATIDYEDFMKGNYRYKQLCSMTASDINGEDILRLPTTHVVGCSCKDGSADIREIYVKIKQFIIDNKITALSDLFSISLFNFVDAQSEHRYLKYLFLCIKE